MIRERVVGHRDLVQDLALDELGDLLDHTAFAAFLHAVGQLGDDDRVLAASQLLDVGTGPHDDAAPTRAVGVADPGASDDVPAGREVRPLDVAQQPLDVDARVVDHRNDPVDRLTEVVGRDVRGHPDGNPG